MADPSNASNIFLKINYKNIDNYMYYFLTLHITKNQTACRYNELRINLPKQSGEP
jgi:hypothetical protein